MIARKKRKSKSKTVTSAHSVVCEYCKKKHLALNAGWTVNGSGMIVCFEMRKDDCFHKVWREAEQKAKQGTS